MRCLGFGEIVALQTKYGPGLVSNLPVLPASSATWPRLLIKVKANAQSTDFREVEI